MLFNVSVSETDREGQMSTEADSERPEVMLGTTSTAPVPPAALEPENTVGGPRIQLYTSLSGGSSYVEPRVNALKIEGNHGPSANRNSPESPKD